MRVNEEQALKQQDSALSAIVWQCCGCGSGCGGHASRPAPQRSDDLLLEHMDGWFRCFLWQVDLASAESRYCLYHASAIGVILTRMAQCFVDECLIPLMVSITPLHSRSRRVLTGVNQAMYPIVIIVLVVLKRSPTDMGGLSSPDQPWGDCAGLVDEGRESTVIFRHLTLRVSDLPDGEDAIRIQEAWTTGSPPDSVLSWQSSTVASEPYAKDVGSIV